MAALSTACLKRDNCPVITQSTPQVSARRRAVPIMLVIAMIGTRGRSRAVKSAVVPDWVKQQIALISVVSAISRAAATIPSATVVRTALRDASRISV